MLKRNLIRKILIGLLLAVLLLQAASMTTFAGHQHSCGVNSGSDCLSDGSGS